MKIALACSMVFLAPLVGIPDNANCKCRMRAYLDDTGALKTGCPPTNCAATANYPAAPCATVEVVVGGSRQIRCYCQGDAGGGIWNDPACSCAGWRGVTDPTQFGCEARGCLQTCEWVSPTDDKWKDVCWCQ